jgi:parallel beta-helix repeat protein
MQKNWVRKGLVCGIIVLFVGASVVPISCADEPLIVYVDDDNNSGQGSGTLNDPYKTIQEGIENVREGGTVYVGNGQYNENIFINKSLKLMKSNMVIPGDNDTDLIIDGGGGYRHVIEIENIQTDIIPFNVIIDGFKIQNSGKRFNNAGIYISGSKNCHIWNNTLSNNSNGIEIIDSTLIDISRNNKICNNLRGKGIYIDGTNSDITIKDNNISNCETYGIYVSSDTNNTNIGIIENNISLCKNGDGIFIYKTKISQIHNNIIGNCGIKNSKDVGNGIKILDSNEITITWNTIFKTTSGISILGMIESKGITIEHNIVSDCFHNGICMRLTVGATLKYNNISGNGLKYEWGSGLYLEGIDTQEIYIKYNFIHENFINVIVSTSNCFSNSNNFQWNNITEPRTDLTNGKNKGLHFFGYLDFVIATYNYWGMKVIPCFGLYGMGKMPLSLFLIYPNDPDPNICW